MIWKIIGLGVFFVFYCIIGFVAFILAQSIAEDDINKQD